MYSGEQIKKYITTLKAHATGIFQGNNGIFLVLNDLIEKLVLINLIG